MSISIEDVLSHKLQECDRRIHSETDQIEYDLASIRAKVKVGSDVYSFARTITSMARLQELLIERSTLRQVREDLKNVQDQAEVKL